MTTVNHNNTSTPVGGFTSPMHVSLPQGAFPKSLAKTMGPYLLVVPPLENPGFTTDSPYSHWKMRYHIITLSLLLANRVAYVMF